MRVKKLHLIIFCVFSNVLFAQKSSFCYKVDDPNYIIDSLIYVGLENEFCVNRVVINDSINNKITITDTLNLLGDTSIYRVDRYIVEEGRWYKVFKDKKILFFEKEMLNKRILAIESFFFGYNNNKFNARLNESNYFVELSYKKVKKNYEIEILAFYKNTLQNKSIVLFNDTTGIIEVDYGLGYKLRLENTP